MGNGFGVRLGIGARFARPLPIMRLHKRAGAASPRPMTANCPVIAATPRRILLSQRKKKQELGGRANARLALGRRNHEAGPRKVHTDLADRGFATSDDDL